LIGVRWIGWSMWCLFSSFKKIALRRFGVKSITRRGCDGKTFCRLRFGWCRGTAALEVQRFSESDVVRGERQGRLVVGRRRVLRCPLTSSASMIGPPGSILACRACESSDALAPTAGGGYAELWIPRRSATLPTGSPVSIQRRFPRFLPIGDQLAA